MLQKIKIFWRVNSPEIIRLLKAILKFSVQIILPIAIEAVSQAEVKFPGSNRGSEKFDFAVDYVKSQAPTAATKAVLGAVNSAWMTREAEDWK